MTACVVAVFTYFPLYKALVVAANPAMAAAIEQAPVTVVADAGECSFQFDPIGRNKFDGTSCDIVKAYLARSGVNYANVAAAPGTAATVRIGGEVPKARSEEHTAELQSLMRNSYAVFCLKKKRKTKKPKKQSEEQTAEDVETR